MTCWFLFLSLAFAASAQITLPPAGPYHVEGNRILDRTGRAYLIRGTSLPPITLEDPAPFSRTTLITLRQRMNMNAVRIPIDAATYPQYRAFIKDLVEKANRQELLAILDSATPDIANDFKSNPNVFFATTIDLAHTLREAGVTQPIIIKSPSDVAHASTRAASTFVSTCGTTAPPQPNPDCKGGDNLIQEISPTYQSPTLPDSEYPLLATGLDPNLADPQQCASFPSDPTAASALIKTLLTTFDQQHINWIISTMEPGKLIDNYRAADWTKLDDGWTCGAPFSGAGMGMTLLSHLWHADPHGVFTVNQPAGGMVIARGANASAYGRILADRETHANSFRLSNISIRVTDSKGVSRLAPLSWTGAGWSSTNLIIPENSAPGPAQVTIVRSDGSKTSSGIIIADVAPGLWTLNYDGRGPVYASTGKASTVRLEGTGFRHAKAVKVLIDGVEAHVKSFGPEPGGSRDQVTITLPSTLSGEADLQLIADGKLSNIARITIPSRVPNTVSSPGSTNPQKPLVSLVRVGQAVPPANFARPAKIQLGHYLFYDKRMSVNSSTSCASCHHQDLAFTDGRAQAIGATGQLHPRSAMSLVNLAYATAFNWNDPSVHSLEQQSLKPMRSTNPIELGTDESSFLKLIRKDAIYQPLFLQAFPQNTNPYTMANVTRAIAAFERTIKSSNSPWDRFHRDGDETALSESAKRGEILFFLDGGPSCFRCHNGPNFSDSAYHNNGLGVEGKFKTPTLRNIAVTAPYMHDGSIATLEKVVDHYATGGKAGHDPIMRGFQMTNQNRTDIVEFLKTLTDESLLHDQRYSNPW